MTCPYLRETRVRYCRRAPQRKFLPRAAVSAENERCSTNGFRGCPVLGEEFEHTPDGPPCPLLHESLMQYCAASAVVHLVPYTDAPLSQCGSGGYRYCDLYLELTHPALEAAGKGIAFEEGLFYTANHWWVDLTGEGACHLGLDAFAVRMIGEPARIDYATRGGAARPVAVITAAGTNWQVAFPERAQVIRCNLYLRSNPARLLEEPYTRGWLFEAELSRETEKRLRDVCRTGLATADWLESETRRVNDRLQQGTACAPDGGVFESGVLAALPREDAVALFHEFLTPVPGERGEG